MAQYYAGGNSEYYNDIDFTAPAWNTDAAYLRLRKLALSKNQILEVGCGSANILRHEPNLQNRYSGCDFSPSLLARNRETYPNANFSQIISPKKIPFPDSSFDLVFSVYVIEHVVYPHLFLEECLRVLRPGGTLALKCPNFLAKGKMSSQGAGFSDGNGGEKLRRGKIIDAFTTGFDRKFKIPALAKKYRRHIGSGYQFYINLNPVCFYYPFKPDYDAIYLTYRPEIESYLKTRVDFSPNNPALSGRDIYMEGHRLA